MSPADQRRHRDGTWVQALASLTLAAWCLDRLGVGLEWWSSSKLWVTWGMDTMSNLGSLSLFVLFLTTAPLNHRQRGGWALAGLALSAHPPAVGILGLGGMLIHRCPEWRYWFGLSLTIALYPQVSNLSLAWLCKLTPRLYDATGARLDQLWLVRRPPLPESWVEMLQWTYLSLPAALALGLYVNARNRERLSFSFLQAYVWAATLGYLTYPMLPMIGPEAFARLHLSDDWSHLVAATQAPSCLPSLHVLWVLLLTRSLAELGGLWAAGSAVYALLVMVASYWIGDHYLIDLWLALPMAAAILQWSRWSGGPTLTSGLLLLLLSWGWVAAFRLMPGWLLDHASLTRGLQVLTAGVALHALMSRKVCNSTPPVTAS